MFKCESNLLLFKGSSKRGPPRCCPVQNSVTIQLVKACACADSERIKMMMMMMHDDDDDFVNRR